MKTAVQVPNSRSLWVIKISSKSVVLVSEVILLVSERVYLILFSSVWAEASIKVNGTYDDLLLNWK